MEANPAVSRRLLVITLTLPVILSPHASKALERTVPGVSVPSGLQKGQGQAGPPGSGEHYVAGEVLVTFRPTAAGVQRENLVRALGDRVAAGLENRPDMAKVRVESGRSVNEAVQAYEADPSVEHAQPNYLYRVQKIPDDPEFGRLWGLDNTGQEVDGVSGVAGKDITAPVAWESQTDCTGVPVAVLDTGINYEHADLAANMWDGDTNHGKDFVGSNDPDPIPDGGHYHGTHVAGTIAAVGNNGQGTTGVCWQAEIMAVRVLDAAGQGTTADIAEGVDYAVAHGARVINMSLVGVGDDTVLHDALADARDQGVLVVTAAGNGGADGVGDNNDANPRYPCNFDLDNILCVAALDPDYTLADYSNYGDQSVDVGAPGTNVFSLFPGPVVWADYVGEWNLDASWSEDSTCSLTYDYLVNPSDWCVEGTTYSNGLSARAYQTYDLTGEGLLGAGFRFYLDYDLNDAGDSLEAAHYPGPDDPFAQTLTMDLGMTGLADTGGFLAYIINARDCLGSQCSAGFRLTTDGTGTRDGVAIAGFGLYQVTSGATQEVFMDGTSMATPHVAGIAALVQAFSPDSGYAAIRDAILQGGEETDALDGMTVTGKAVDAAGALASLNQPPSVADATLTTQEDTTGAVTLSASDPDGGPLSWRVSTTPDHGSASVDDAGKVTYTPEPGYSGGDSFTVEVIDSAGGTDTAGVAVTVEPVASGEGSRAGCTLATRPRRPDPLWVLLLVSWIWHYLRRRKIERP